MATIQAGKSGTHARCRVRRVQALKGDEGPEKGQIPPELGSCHPSLPSPGIHTAQANSVGKRENFNGAVCSKRSTENQAVMSSLSSTLMTHTV